MASLIESPSRIEPCLIEQAGGPLLDLVADLTDATARLGIRLHPESAGNLADLVRIMNCYYSNLIEGHNTAPRDIERALADQFAPDTERRSLQLEARAHIRVQQEIDSRFVAGILPEPASPNFIRALHQAFYADMPEDQLLVGSGRSVVRMQPGQFRADPGHEVSVGRHLPPSADAVEAFMALFARRYHLPVSAVAAGSSRSPPPIIA